MKTRKLNEQVVMAEVVKMRKNQTTHRKIKKTLRPLSLADIAHKYGVSRQAISQIVAKYEKLQIHNPGEPGEAEGKSNTVSQANAEE